MTHHVKLTAATFDRMKLHPKSPLSRFLPGGLSARREHLGFRVRFRLSDAYEAVLKQEHDASSIKLHSQGEMTDNDPIRYMPSPDFVRRRTASTQSMVNTTASTGAPSIPVTLTLPKVKSTHNNRSKLQDEDSLISYPSNKKTTSSPVNIRAYETRITSTEKSHGITKDSTEIPTVKKPKRPESNEKCDGKWKMTNEKPKLESVPEERSKHKSQKALKAGSKNESVSSKMGQTSRAATAAEENAKLEDPDENDGVPVAHYIYNLVNCRETTNPEFILKCQTAQKQVVGIINLYDNHGKPFGERAMATPVCDLCTEYRRKRVSSWLQSLYEGPTTYVHEFEEDNFKDNFDRYNRRGSHSTRKCVRQKGWLKDRVKMKETITSRLERTRPVEPVKDILRQSYKGKHRNIREVNNTEETDKTPDYTRHRPVVNGWTSELIESPTNTKLSIRLSPIKDENHVTGFQENLQKSTLKLGRCAPSTSLKGSHSARPQRTTIPFEDRV